VCITESQSIRREAERQKSLNILREAERQGYVIGVKEDGTITATKNGTMFLRLNSDIEHFGRLIGEPKIS
jgi:hypothetical protein